MFPFFMFFPPYRNDHTESNQNPVIPIRESRHEKDACPYANATFQCEDHIPEAKHAVHDTSIKEELIKDLENVIRKLKEQK